MEATKSEIATFDLNKAAEAIRGKIRAAFVEMIPEEQWDKMVKTEIDAFLKEGLTRIVAQELDTELRKRCVDYFRTPEWQEQWDGQMRHVASKKIQELLVNHAPDILAAMFGEAFQKTFNDMRCRLHDNRP